jgi:hypothetical protein
LNIKDIALFLGGSHGPPGAPPSYGEDYGRLNGLERDKPVSALDT